MGCKISTLFVLTTCLELIFTEEMVVGDVAEVSQSGGQLDEQVPSEAANHHWSWSGTSRCKPFTSLFKFHPSRISWDYAPIDIVTITVNKNFWYCQLLDKKARQLQNPLKLRNLLVPRRLVVVIFKIWTHPPSFTARLTVGHRHPLNCFPPTPTFPLFSFPAFNFYHSSTFQPPNFLNFTTFWLSHFSTYQLRHFSTFQLSNFSTFTTFWLIFQVIVLEPLSSHLSKCHSLF